MFIQTGQGVLFNVKKSSLPDSISLFTIRDGIIDFLEASFDGLEKTVYFRCNILSELMNGMDDKLSHIKLIILNEGC